MDTNKIKQMLAQFKASGVRTSDHIWKPPAGKTTVRLVEYKYDKDNPFVELYFHFNIAKNKPMLSPISYGEPDPIVEFANKLKKLGDKESWLLSKKLEPKLRVYAPIIIRGEENSGVKLWGFGKTVAEEIMAFIVDPDYGNIADTLQGRDIVVETITKEEAKNLFGKTNIRVKPVATPLHTNAELVQKFLDEQPNIVELFQRYTYEDLETVLKEYLEPTEEGVAAATSTAPTTSVSATTSNTELTKSAAAFNDIFDA